MASRVWRLADSRSARRAGPVVSSTVLASPAQFANARQPTSASPSLQRSPISRARATALCASDRLRGEVAALRALKGERDKGSDLAGTIVRRAQPGEGPLQSLVRPCVVRGPGQDLAERESARGGLAVHARCRHLAREPGELRLRLRAQVEPGDRLGVQPRGAQPDLPDTVRERPIAGARRRGRRSLLFPEAIGGLRLGEVDARIALRAARVCEHLHDPAQRRIRCLSLAGSEERRDQVEAEVDPRR